MLKMIGYYRVLSYLVRLTNDMREDYIELLDLNLSCFYSYYTNMISKQEKQDILNLSYEILDNKDLLQGLDNHKDYKLNKESLERVNHILEINY